MRIILTDDVLGLGDVGQEVNVKPGYARNFLLPRGKAIELGTATARVLSHKMKQVEAKKKRLKASAEEVATKLRSENIELELRVGSNGKVFGSLNARDISENLISKGYDVDRRRVILSEPIKKIGVHFVNVKLHPEVEVQFKVITKPVEATKEQEDQAAEELRERIETATEEIAAESN